MTTATSQPVGAIINRPRVNGSGKTNNAKSTSRLLFNMFNISKLKSTKAHQMHRHCEPLASKYLKPYDGEAIHL